MSRKEALLIAHAFRSRWLQVQHVAVSWWRARTVRERRLLSVAFVLAAMALVWLAWLKPALTAVQQANTALPELRAQAAELKAIEQEIAVLKQQGRASLDPALFDQSLKASLLRAGLAERLVVSVPQEAAPGLREIVVDRAGSAVLMHWLAQASGPLQFKVQQLSLVRARVQGRDLPGYVSGRIRLLAPGGETP